MTDDKKVWVNQWGTLTYCGDCAKADSEPDSWEEQDEWDDAMAHCDRCGGCLDTHSPCFD